MFFLWKKIRTSGWIISGFIAKRKKIIIASAVIGIASFLFITKILLVIPQPKPTQRIGYVGRYTWESLPLTVQHKISQGLTVVLPDGTPAPALASAWQVSEDGKQYTFDLKPNLSWQDGTPFKSSDLRYPFSDVTIETPDEKTIIFHLKEPFAPFPVIASLPVFKDQMVGVGTYKIRQLKKRGEIIEKITLDGPQNLTFKFYPTQTAAIQAFKLGEIDTLKDLWELPLNGQWQKYIFLQKEVRHDQYLAAFFNLKDPILADKKIRQALAYAAKRDHDLERAIGPLNPQSWAYSDDIKRYDFDPAKAKDLLDKAFQEENSQEATKSGKPRLAQENLSLKIDTTPTLLSLTEELKQSWQEVLGIKVSVETVNTLPADFQILLIGQEIPADPDQYPLWHSTQPQNFTHYQSPKVDKLLEDARRILDQTKRKERYDDFQRFLLEDAPAVFLYHPLTYTISRHPLSATP